MNLAFLKQSLMVMSLITAVSPSVFAMEEGEEPRREAPRVSHTVTSCTYLYNTICSLETNAKEFTGALDVYAKEKGVTPTDVFSALEWVEGLQKECSVSKSFAKALSKMDSRDPRREQALDLIPDFRDSLKSMRNGIKGDLLKDCEKNYELSKKAYEDSINNFLDTMSVYLPEEVAQYKKTIGQHKPSPKEESGEGVRLGSLKKILDAAKSFEIEIPTKLDLTTTDLCRDHPVLIFLEKMTTDGNVIHNFLNELKQQKK